MKSERIFLQNICLSSIQVEDEGATAVLGLVDTIHPHREHSLRLVDVLAMHILRTPGDKFPYFLGELSCDPMEVKDARSVLKEIGYPFSIGRPIGLSTYRQVVHIQFDGAITGRIVAKEVWPEFD